jgi:hypothetical protein
LNADARHVLDRARTDLDQALEDRREFRLGERVCLRDRSAHALHQPGRGGQAPGEQLGRHLADRAPIRTKLTDTQLVLLSAASQRDDRTLERPPNPPFGLGRQSTPPSPKPRNGHEAGGAGFLRGNSRTERVTVRSVRTGKPVLSGSSCCWFRGAPRGPARLRGTQHRSADHADSTWPISWSTPDFSQGQPGRTNGNAVSNPRIRV